MWKQKSRLYNLSRKNKILHSNFARLRKAFTSLPQRKKAEYLKSLANDLGNSSRRFWSTYLSPNKNTKIFPSICSGHTTYCIASKIARFVAEFFAQAVASFTFIDINICLQFCKAHLTHLKPSSVSCNTLPLAFSPPTLKQIKRAMKKLDRSTAVGYFGLPVAVLIHCALRHRC